MASGSGETPWERFCRPLMEEASEALPVFEVGIPVRDGVELGADVYLPAES
jgi:predicted acyl esterase